MIGKKSLENLKLLFQKHEKIKPIDPTTPVRDDHVRFVCLSDMHSAIETLQDFVPEGDVILHAGDFTQIGLPSAIQKFDQYLGKSHTSDA